MRPGLPQSKIANQEPKRGSRLDRIRAALDEAKLDALMICAPGEETLGKSSRYYTSGFTGSAGVV